MRPHLPHEITDLRAMLGSGLVEPSAASTLRCALALLRQVGDLFVQASVKDVIAEAEIRMNPALRDIREGALLPCLAEIIDVVED